MVHLDAGREGSPVNSAIRSRADGKHALARGEFQPYLATCGREAGEAGSNLTGAARETGIIKEGESKLRNLSRRARGSGLQGWLQSQGKQQRA